MPKPIGVSEWSQRASRPDEEPTFLDDPRVAEAVKQRFTDPHKRWDRFLARAYGSALRECGILSPDDWREACECAERLMNYKKFRFGFSGIELVLALVQTKQERITEALDELRENRQQEAEMDEMM